MALYISSPVTGSLQVRTDNPSASTAPTRYYTNLSTVTVIGDPNYQSNSATIGAVVLESETQGNIATFPLSQIAQISASTQSFGLQWAVDSISKLIMK